MVKNLTNHFIAWNDEGDISLVKWPDTEMVSAPIPYSWGACDFHVSKANLKRRKELLLIRIWSLALVYGIPVSRIRKSLRELQEFKSFDRNAESI